MPAAWHVIRPNPQAANVLTALSFWAGRSLRACFLLWRTYVHEAQFKWSVAGQHLMWVLVTTTSPDAHA